jgi:hypothetical protein
MQDPTLEALNLAQRCISSLIQVTERKGALEWPDMKTRDDAIKSLRNYQATIDRGRQHYQNLTASN